jgi:hypothetical protein
VIQTNTTSDLIEWAREHGFVVDPQYTQAIEKAWPHRTGFGFITMRMVFGSDDGSADIVLLDGGNGINIGWVANSDEAQSIHDLLERFSYDNRKQAQP